MQEYNNIKLYRFIFWWSENLVHVSLNTYDEMTIKAEESHIMENSNVK